MCLDKQLDETTSGMVTSLDAIFNNNQFIQEQFAWKTESELCHSHTTCKVSDEQHSELMFLFSKRTHLYVHPNAHRQRK